MACLTGQSRCIQEKKGSTLCESEFQIGNSGHNREDIALNSLALLVEGYLESAGFKILEEYEHCVVADRFVFAEDRDTRIVWTIPEGQKMDRYESVLRASVSMLRSKHPDAKATVLSSSRSGFSRPLQQELNDQRIRILVPIQFFDTEFKFERAPKAASAIKDIRSTKILSQRVCQPYSAEGVTVDTSPEGDLLDTLSEELSASNTSTVRIVVGRAGMGKTFLFRAVFAHLYKRFMKAKAQQGSALRPIPLLPDHMKDLYALRTELLIENFLRTDVASPVTRGTFEWLLVNGFTIWLLDGLDELLTGDPGFFDYLLELITRPGSQAKIVIWSRDSLLTTSDAFMEFQELCAGSDRTTQVYRLSPWGRASRRHFAWISLEGRHPSNGESDTREISRFLENIERSPSLRNLSGVPFYCDVLLRQSRDGSIPEFSDEVVMLDHLIEEMIQREIDKGLIDRKAFQPDGLRDWLEQLAVNYVEEGCYTEIDSDEALEYGKLVLLDHITEEVEMHILLSLLRFPLFSAGTESGKVGFAHDLIAEALAARYYARKLPSEPISIARRVSSVDLDDPIRLRFMAQNLEPHNEADIVLALRTASLQENAYKTMLSLLMMVRPDRDQLKRLQVNLEGAVLSSVGFVNRDLSGVSFRQTDLSNSLFNNCDLRGAKFEGAFLNRTKFVGRTDLEGADFGDLMRVQSFYVGKSFLDNDAVIRDWVEKTTGRRRPINQPCPTALQVTHLFRKFVTPMGIPRRDGLKREGLLAGRRFTGAPKPKECLDAVVRHGFLVGPDHRDKFKRAAGDKYGDIIRLVRDSSVSQALGVLVAELCRRRSCTHELRSSPNL